MLSVAKPTFAQLDALLGDQRDKQLSYSDVGATRSALPEGYGYTRHAVELGAGEAVFERAVEGLRHWQAHVGAGIAVHPPGRAVEEGLAVALVVRVCMTWVTVATRVVYVVDEPDRSGFAYGTLPHHLVEGEELFLLERGDGDVVRFSVTAFMRPRGRALRPAGSVAGRVSLSLVRRYASALRQHAADPA